MRTIDASIIERLQSGELRAFALLKMTIDGIDFCYTDCDVPLLVDGDFYESKPIRLEPIRYSRTHLLDKAELTIANASDELTAAYEDGEPQGSDVILKIAVLDIDEVSGDYEIIGAVTVFQGELDAWALDEREINNTVTNQFARWNQKTLNRHSSSCRYKTFKGDFCQYSGEATWCDRTYERCELLGNEANFGGCRWLPSIQGKTIWWGRQQGQDLPEPD